MSNIDLLRGALAANAAFSSLTGLAALILAGTLEESLGPPAWALRAVGAGLLGFAALVAREAREPRRAGARQIIAADLAWVISAAIVVAVAPGWLTSNGRIVLISVTAIVAAVAAAQWRGLEAAS